MRSRRIALAALLGLLVLAAPATARDVKTSASLVIATKNFEVDCSNCGPGGTPTKYPNCAYVVYAQVSPVAGATSYNVVVKDNHPRINTTRNFTGPPFGTANDYNIPPPAAEVWGLTAGNGPPPCPTDPTEGGRFEILKAVATTDDKLRISGTVREADGKAVKGVKVSIKGPTSKTATTDAGGAYSTLVKKGSYTVTAPKGYCVTGPKTCTNVKAMKVSSGTEVVNFARRAVRLSGQVSAHECTPESCRPLPSNGVTITARGESAPVSTTTNATGGWEMSVPTGTWTVTPSSPGRRFEPPADKVDARRDVSGIDFESCVFGAGASSSVRARAAQRGGSACDPDGIDWEMPPRVNLARDDVDGLDGLISPKSITPRRWKVDVLLVKGGKKIACPATTRWRWTVDETPEDATVPIPPKPGCGTTMEVSRLGTYTVSAYKQVRKNGRFVDADSKPFKTQKVVVKDWLILGMGDSNGSGEGNPPFFFERCNRGTASYQFLTALEIENADPRSSVTFLHPACSGASVEHVYDRGYEGTRGGSPPLRPQIKQVNRKLIASANLNKSVVRKPDAVLLSAGVNNLEFGAVMSFCVETGFSQHLLLYPPSRGPGEPPGPDQSGVPDSQVPPCEGLKVRGISKSEQKWRIDAYKEDRKGKTVARRVREGLDSLPKLFAQLNNALSTSVARGGAAVSGSRVFAAGYPDFSRDDSGRTCNTDPRIRATKGIAKLQKSTWAWLGRTSEALNKQVRAGAAAADWQFVPTRTTFRQHGYCANDSWFREIIAAISTGDLAGPFHPTLVGHDQEFRATYPLVCEKLYGNPRCQSKRP